MAERRRKKEEEQANTMGWIVTWSDLSTLLLTFFVLLLSLANMDAKQATEAMGSLREAFGVLEGGRQVEVTDDKLMESIELISGSSKMPISNIIRQLQSRIGKKRLKADVIKPKQSKYRKNTTQDVIIRLDDSILFAPGSYKLSPSGEETILNMGDVLEGFPFDIRVEGHTDSLPPGKGQPSNWEMSTYRAMSVMKFLVEQEFVEQEQISITGYGDTKPVAPNDSKENRAKNRRVDIVLLFPHEKLLLTHD